MFGIESLDVMIGIITIYLIFALACTAIVEAISAWFGVRSEYLEASLKELLHGNLAEGTDFVEAFFQHPIVQSLSKGTKGRPSYITPEIVGQVVASMVYERNRARTLRQAINSLPDTTQTNRVKGLLEALQHETGEDIAAFRKLIAAHYDAAMDRASGWYKRYTQSRAIIISAVLVIGANVDTLSLANSLSSNPEARAKMVAIAQQQYDAASAAEASAGEQNKEGKNPAPGASSPATINPGLPAAGAGGATGSDPLDEARKRTEAAAQALTKANADLSAAGIQLGWKGDYPRNPADIASKIIGLLLSILAISLGAPFWFDILNRVMQVRGAGISPRDKKPASAAEAPK